VSRQKRARFLKAKKKEGATALSIMGEKRQEEEEGGSEIKHKTVSFWNYWPQISAKEGVSRS